MGATWGEGVVEDWRCTPRPLKLQSPDWGFKGMLHPSAWGCKGVRTTQLGGSKGCCTLYLGGCAPFSLGVQGGAHHPAWGEQGVLHPLSWGVQGGAHPSAWGCKGVQGERTTQPWVQVSVHPQPGPAPPSKSSLGDVAWFTMTSFQVHLWSSVRWMLLEY